MLLQLAIEPGRILIGHQPAKDAQQGHGATRRHPHLVDILDIPIALERGQRQVVSNRSQTGAQRFTGGIRYRIARGSPLNPFSLAHSTILNWPQHPSLRRRRQQSLQLFDQLRSAHVDRDHLSFAIDQKRRGNRVNLIFHR